MKKIIVAIFITCCLSASAQKLKIKDMVSLLNQSKKLFNKEFWKEVKFYESFGTPMQTVDKALLKHGLQFNNFDMEEGEYEEVDLRYLTKEGSRKELRLTLKADLDNSVSYSFKEEKELNALKKELQTLGAQFQKTKNDTIAVTGMDHISVDQHYSYGDKTIVFTESRFVTPRSAGRPDYYVRIWYR